MVHMYNDRVEENYIVKCEVRHRILYSIQVSTLSHVLLMMSVTWLTLRRGVTSSWSPTLTKNFYKCFMGSVMRLLRWVDFV